MKASALFLVTFLSLLAAGCRKEPPAPSGQDAIEHAPTPEAKPTLPAPARTATSLDELIGFSDGVTCKPNPATQRLLTNLLVRTADAKELVLGNVIVPKDFATAFGKLRLIKESDDSHTYYEAEVPIIGLWHGLKLAKISSAGMINSDAGAWTYSFDEPFERVRSVLNTMGFDFDKAGNQPRDPAEDYEWARLSVDEGLTMLSCDPRGTPPTVEESGVIAASLRQAEAAIPSR